MTTQLETTRAALAAAEEQHRLHEIQGRELRAERAQLVAMPASAGYAAKQRDQFTRLDAEIAQADVNARMARARVEEARQQLSSAENTISMARAKVGGLRAAADGHERLAARAREQAAGWEAQRDQSLVALEQARIALAELLGVNVDELDPPAVVPEPPKPVESIAPVRSPRQVKAPRLVIAFGVRKWFDDATGQEVNVDGSPLASG